jgi:hypothetical protein
VSAPLARQTVRRVGGLSRRDFGAEREIAGRDLPRVRRCTETLRKCRKIKGETYVGYIESTPRVRSTRRVSRVRSGASTRQMRAPQPTTASATTPIAIGDGFLSPPTRPRKQSSRATAKRPAVVTVRIPESRQGNSITASPGMAFQRTALQGSMRTNAPQEITRRTHSRLLVSTPATRQNARIPNCGDQDDHQTVEKRCGDRKD